MLLVEDKIPRQTSLPRDQVNPDRFTFIRPDLRQFRGINGFRLQPGLKGEILILATLDRHHADIAQGILALA
jgi:hypothetical protein